MNEVIVLGAIMAWTAYLVDKHLHLLAAAVSVAWKIVSRWRRRPTMRLHEAASPYRGVSDCAVSAPVVDVAFSCWCSQCPCEHLRARLRYQPPECWPDWYRAEQEAKQRDRIRAHLCYQPPECWPAWYRSEIENLRVQRERVLFQPQISRKD